MGRGSGTIGAHSLPSCRPRFPTRFTSHPSSRRLFPRVLPPRRGPEGEARRTRGDASRADEVNRVNRGGELGGYEGSFVTLRPPVVGRGLRPRGERNERHEGRMDRGRQAERDGRREMQVKGRRHERSIRAAFTVYSPLPSLVRLVALLLVTSFRIMRRRPKG